MEKVSHIDLVILPKLALNPVEIMNPENLTSELKLLTIMYGD